MEETVLYPETPIWLVTKPHLNLETEGGNLTEKIIFLKEKDALQEVREYRKESSNLPKDKRKNAIITKTTGQITGVAAIDIWQVTWKTPKFDPHKGSYKHTEFQKHFFTEAEAQHRAKLLQNKAYQRKPEDRGDIDLKKRRSTIHLPFKKDRIIG